MSQKKSVVIFIPVEHKISHKIKISEHFFFFAVDVSCAFLLRNYVMNYVQNFHWCYYVREKGIRV